jgi:hypothetical protein
MAFKQATALMVNPMHNESVNSIIERLSLKHSLIGAKKSLTRSTLYRAVSKVIMVRKAQQRKGQKQRFPKSL